MIDKEKVKLMTHIAIYEKNYGRDDEKISNFHKKDFISYNNFKMQISLTFILLLVFGAEFSISVMNDITALSIQGVMFLGVKYIAIWIGFLIFYTINQTKTNKKHYDEFEKRIEKYKKMLKALGEMQ